MFHLPASSGPPSSHSSLSQSSSGDIHAGFASAASAQDTRDHTLPLWEVWWWDAVADVSKETTRGIFLASHVLPGQAV